MRYASRHTFDRVQTDLTDAGSKKITGGSPLSVMSRGKPDSDRAGLQTENYTREPESEIVKAHS